MLGRAAANAVVEEGRGFYLFCDDDDDVDDDVDGDVDDDDSLKSAMFLNDLCTTRRSFATNASELIMFNTGWGERWL